jgi:hypothetical protein
MTNHPTYFHSEPPRLRFVLKQIYSIAAFPELPPVVAPTQQQGQRQVMVNLNVFSIVAQLAENLRRCGSAPFHGAHGLGIFDRGSCEADLAHALRHSEADVGLVFTGIDHFKKQRSILPNHLQCKLNVSRLCR